jgi:hypothetical protein
MNWRFYTRGLGIGIVVTALLLIFTEVDGVAALSDDEIRERARMLGMTESMTLSELDVLENGAKDEPDDELPTDSATGQEVVATVDPISDIDPPIDTGSDSTMDFNGDDLPTDNGSDSSNDEEPPTDNGNQDNDTIPTDNTSIPDPDPVDPIQNVETPPDDMIVGGTVAVQVNSGDDSFRVSSRLEDAGLVESASAYNRFLMDNGYSRSIRVGSHSIPSDADYETIARILTGRR